MIQLDVKSREIKTPMASCEAIGVPPGLFGGMVSGSLSLHGHLLCVQPLVLGLRI